VRIRRYADLGVLVETDTTGQALALCAAVEAAGIGARARPGWRTVLVEPADAAGGAATGRLEGAVRELAAGVPADAAAPPGRLVELTVVYDGEDLPAVSRALGMSVDDVVHRHAAGVYTVVCLGFSRAFPYLEGVDPALRLPRRATPRERVPAGSVAIAADQAGVYPWTSPGGWHLLGRTAAVLFDPDRDPPSALRPGDRVRFVPAVPGGGSP
jgi:KipI family sensor histidine kinase inhibitor